MTPDELAALFSPDLNLSPEARSLVAFVGVSETTEFPYPRLLRLLHIGDEKKLRRVIGEAEEAGWLSVERQTGKGHHPQMVYTPPKNGTLKDTPPKNGTLSDYRVPEKGSLSCASSLTTTTSSPSSPKESAREPIAESAPETDLARLRAFLGDHAYAVGMMVKAASHPSTWAASVYGKYGPNGTQSRAFAGIPPPDIPAVLGTILIDYAGKKSPYDNRLFDGFARTAIQAEQRKLAKPERGGAGRTTPSEGRRPTGTEGASRRSGFKFE